MERTGNLNHVKMRAETAAPTISRKTLNRIGMGVMIALISYLIGFVPAWLWAKGFEYERDRLESALRPSELQNALANATINARRKEYEPARRQASDFFTALREEADRDESVFDPEQRKNVNMIIAERDEIITLLARNDPAAVSRLTELYLAFTKLKNSPATGKE